MDFGLWPKKQDPENAKACSIHHMVVTTVREHTRARYARKSLIPHGIKLTISKEKKDAQEAHTRLKTSELRRIRQKTAFDFQRFVKGWKGPAHIAYCEKKGYVIPSIPELELGSTESQKGKTELELGSKESQKGRRLSQNGNRQRAVQSVQNAQQASQNKTARKNTKSLPTNRVPHLQPSTANLDSDDSDATTLGKSGNPTATLPAPLKRVCIIVCVE